MNQSRRAQLSALAFAAIVFLIVLLVRFLSIDFNNDDFHFLAKARQVLHGALPFRDFADPGIPGHVFMSAALMQMFGYRLLAEAVFDCVMIAAGTAISAWLSVRLTGSLWLSSMLALVALALYPRMYAYSKVIVLALTLLTFWHYAHARSARAAVTLGVLAAGAFWWRHDYVVYIGISSAALLTLCHRGPELIRRAGLAAAVAALLVLPYLSFVALNGGLAEYGRQALEYVRGHGEFEADAPRPVFRIDWSAPLIAVRPPPDLGWPVTIGWVAGISDGERVAREQRNELRNGQRTGEVWRYELFNATPEHVRALLDDPSMATIEGIDRDTATPTSAPREGPVAWLLRRIPLLRMTVLPGVLTEANALPLVAFLCYGTVLTASVRLVLTLGGTQLRVTADPRVPFLASATVLGVLSVLGLLRPPFSDRLGDVAVPCTVLAAGLLAQYAGPPQVNARRLEPLLRLAWKMAVAVTLGVVFLSALTFTRMGLLMTPEGLRSAVSSGPSGVAQRVLSTGADLAVTPPIDAWVPEPTVGLRAAIRYVRRCSPPSEPVLTLFFGPNLNFFADRDFAAGQAFFQVGLYATEPDQELMISRLTSRPAGLIVADLTMLDGITGRYSLLTHHINAHYTMVADTSLGASGPGYRFWVPRDRPGLTTDPWTGLPCGTGGPDAARITQFVLQ